VNLRRGRRPAILAALLLVSAGAHALTWAALWSTPDQRAQRLLQSGDAVAAARLFHDPRRRAYAQIEARQYAAAARLLQPYPDPISEYNRGNALARAGQLSAALGAYKAAMKQAPRRRSLYRDARHNRDLVEAQLKARQQQRQQKQQQQKQQPNRQQKSAPAAGQQSPGSQSPQNAGGTGTGSGGGGQSASQKQQRYSAQPGEQNRNEPQSANGRQVHHGRQGKTGRENPSGGQRAGAQPRKAAGQRQPANAAARAKRDAAAALGRAPRDLGGERSPPPQPESEQSMSLDQWLRWIPDDPAGLLRRKFMIEHLLQQREDSQR